MKVLSMALLDMPEKTSSEMDFSVPGSSGPLKPESKKEFFSLVKKANYIAIDSDYLYSLSDRSLASNPVTTEMSFNDSSMAELPICPPFKCQWVEISAASRNSMAPSLTVSGTTVVTVLGMLINETSPNLYDIFIFENYRKIDAESGHYKFSLARNVPGTGAEGSNLQMCFAVWMKAINGGALGIEEGEDFVMLPKENAKKDGKKKPHQIRRIVRIVPKNSKHKVEPIMPRGKIDFSHRWEVRGHWRRVPGMGKDREGNYEIRGLTWVSNFIKGPGELPLIQKLRWVPGQAS